MNKRFILLLTLAAVTACLLTPGYAKMYQWVDEKGEVHISDAPVSGATNAPSAQPAEAAQEPSASQPYPSATEAPPDLGNEEYVIIPLGKKKRPLTKAIAPSAVKGLAPAVIEEKPAPVVMEQKPAPVVEEKPAPPTAAPTEIVTPLVKAAPAEAPMPAAEAKPVEPVKEAPKPAETAKAPDEPKPAPTVAPKAAETKPAPEEMLEEMPEEFMMEPEMEFAPEAGAGLLDTLPIPPGIIAMVMGFVFIILGVFAVIYLFYSFCIFRIGRKLGVDKPWIAFIPVVGNWTLVQAGSKSALWFALMLMPWVITAITVPLAIFMPDIMMLVGAPLGLASLLFSLLSIVAFFVVWAGVIGNLGKNKLLVLLFLVPFGALILPAYFAFSKAGGGAGAPSEAGGEAGFGEEGYVSEESSSEDIAGDALASLGISDDMLSGGEIDESRLLPGGTEEAPAGEEEPSFEMPVEEGPSMEDLLEQHSFGAETSMAEGATGTEGLEPTSFAGEEAAPELEDMDKTLVDQSGIGGEPSADIGGFGEGDFGELPIDSSEAAGEDTLELDDSMDISGIEEPSSDEQEQTIIDHGIPESPNMGVSLESDMDLAGLDEISLDDAGTGEEAGEITLDEESLDAPLDMGDFSADFDLGEKGGAKGFDQTIIDRGMDIGGSDEPLDLDIDESKE